MSVLACNRLGCENIMCDRYSYKYGYICNECFNELLSTQDLTIEEFMDTCKDDGGATPEYDWKELCNKEFREE